MDRSFADFYKRRPQQKARAAFKKAGKWLGALGLGALLFGYVGAVVNEIAPAPRLAKDLACQWREWWAEPAPGTHFTILVSNLAEDPDGRQTKLVRDVFLNQAALDVRQTCRVVRLVSAKGSLADAEAGAAAAGRAMLDDWNADLLVWGEVIERNKELYLWFVTREEGATMRRPSYSLTEKISLPIDFRKDIAQQIEAVAFSLIELHEDRLDSALEKLRTLLSQTSDEALQPRRTALLYAFGRAAAARGARDGDRHWLMEAVAAYEKVLQQWPRERIPLAWAAVEQSLAGALTTIGSLDMDQTPLRQALASYRRSSAEWSNAGVLARVAAINREIGTSLALLAHLQQDQSRLEEAVAHYRGSLDGFKAQGALFEWAAVQSELGDVLRGIGRIRSSHAKLQDELSSYRESLSIWTRNQWPTLWAATRRKVCGVLADLWLLSKKHSHLREALDACEGALEVVKRDDILPWSLIQLDLITLLIMSGEWNHAFARLENVSVQRHLDFANQSREEKWLNVAVLLRIIDIMSVAERSQSLVDIASAIQNHLKG